MTEKFSEMHRLVMWRRRQLVRRATWHEKLMQEILSFLGVRWKFQVGCLCKGVAVRMVDFKLPNLNLFLEVDGPSHDGREKEDADRERQILLSKPTYRFVRFTNHELETSTYVSLLVWQRLRQTAPTLIAHRLTPYPGEVAEGSGSDKLARVNESTPGASAPSGDRRQKPETQQRNGRATSNPGND